MRSRYTAFARGDIDYIMGTHAPAEGVEIDRAETEKWSRESEWLGLTIVATEAGGPDDDEGIVEFIARFRTGGRELAHRERSRFRRSEGRWFYVDGDTVKPPPVRAEKRVGRNEPCPCGSGKKYKRCHGAE